MKLLLFQARVEIHVNACHKSHLITPQCSFSPIFLLFIDTYVYLEVFFFKACAGKSSMYSYENRGDGGHYAPFRSLHFHQEIAFATSCENSQVGGMLQYIHMYVSLYLFPESVEFVFDFTMQYINTFTNNLVICIDIPRLF